MIEENDDGILCSIKKIFKHKNAETVRETIEDLIEEAGDNGDKDLSEHEQLLLNNILCIKEKKCVQVMVPRADIVAFQQDGSIKRLAELMISKGHSRIPVYGESLDDITGVIHVIDLVKSILKGKQDLKAKDIVSREVKFVSPSMRVLDLLREMQLNKIHLAMVIDEYGGIDGLITIEDLLEEIVGDIEDEYDLDEQHIVPMEDNASYIADAKTDLAEIKEVTGLDLCKDIDAEDLEIDTLGGCVFHILQRIPTRGEMVNGPSGVKFRILEVDPRRIKKIMIIKPKANDDAKHK